MCADKTKFVQILDTYLAGSGCSATATTITLKSLKLIDGETNVTMTNFGTIGHFTSEPGIKKREENGSFTGITQNASGTATLTGVTRGLQCVSPYTADSNLRKAHSGGSLIVFSNSAPFYDKLSGKDNDETWTGVNTYTNPNYPRMDSAAIAPTADEQLATKKYVDDVGAGGTLSNNRIVIAGTAGATIAKGEVIYFDATDKEWKLADASASSTSENVLLGIAQGVGTNGAEIAGGVLLNGLDSNQTGMTAGTKQFLSDTAGELSETTGTKEVSLGFSQSASTTEFIFSPRYDQQLIEDQQDALAGNNGTPSSTNTLVTQIGFQRGVEVYAADNEASDTYVITLSPAIVAYVAGMKISFKAKTANTGACTINVNAKGAKAIKKNYNETLEDNDIVANQIVSLIYDGTNFQLLSPRALMAKSEADILTDGSDADSLHIHTLSLDRLTGVGYPTVNKTYFNFQIDVPQNANAVGYPGIFSCSAWIPFSTVGDTSYGAYVVFGGNGDVDFSLMTRAAVWPSLVFAKKDVIVEFALKYNDGANEAGWGLSEDDHSFQDYDDATKDAVCFTVGADGKLYAKTANGSASTETEITGITLDAVNTYRIEYEVGVAARFYVNHVLEETVTTTLPNGNVIRFGVGADGNDGFFTLTTPYFAVEK